VESGWRGVQDLSVQVSPRTEEENLLGTAVTSSSFGLWCCPLRRVNRDPMVTPEKFMQMRKQAAAKREQEQKHAIEIEKPLVPPQNVFVAQAQNNLLPHNNPFPMGQMGMNQNSNQLYPSPGDMFQPYPNNFGFNQHSMPVEQIDQFANMMAQNGDPRFSNNFNPGGFGGFGMGQENNFNMLNADPHRRISLQRLPGETAMNEERPPLKEEDNNTKDSSSIIKASDPMSMSTFMKDIESDSNKIHFDTISDVP